MLWINGIPMVLRSVMHLPRKWGLAVHYERVHDANQIINE